MRPESRYLDDNEHERPVQVCQHDVAADAGDGKGQPRGRQGPRRGQARPRWPRRSTATAATVTASPSWTPAGAEKRRSPALANMILVHMIEMLSWGDAGVYLCIPASALARRGHQRRRHARTARALPAPLHRRRAQVGRHGHDRAAGRFRHQQHPDHGHLRRRDQRVGAQRPEDLLHQRQAGAGGVGRPGRGLGHGRQEGRPRRHEALRRRGRHARRASSPRSRRSWASAPATPPPSSSTTPHPGRQHPGRCRSQDRRGQQGLQGRHEDL